MGPPDDPRGGLRWALSKLRSVVDVPGFPVIIADRERVALALPEGAVDLGRLRLQLDPQKARLLAILDLRMMPQDLSRPVLDGLDLPQSELWQNWVIGIRAEATGLWHTALGLLLDHPDRADHDVLRWANAWLLSDPLALQPAQALVQTRRRLGRADDASALTQDYRDAARAAGLSPVPILRPTAPRSRRVPICTRRSAFVLPMTARASPMRWSDKGPLWSRRQTG